MKLIEWTKLDQAGPKWTEVDQMDQTTIAWI